MIGGLWDRATGLLDRRFILGALVPVLTFAGGVITLAGAHYGWNKITMVWQRLPVAAAFAIAGAAFLAAIMAASFIMHHLIPLTRLLEGYWGTRWPGRPLRVWGLRRQAKRWERFCADPRRYAIRFHEFPVSRADLLPTRLGNVLRSAESYSGDERRYAMDAVFFWPRLLLVVPDTTRAALAEARSGIDAMVIATTLSTCFAPVAAFLGFTLDLPVTVWLPAGVAALLLARLSYLAAVRAAISFGVLVRATFDVHRRDLIRALGVSLPETLDEERALWRTLGQLLYRRGPDDEASLRFAADADPRPDTASR